MEPNLLKGWELPWNRVEGICIPADHGSPALSDSIETDVPTKTSQQSAARFCRFAMPGWPFWPLFRGEGSPTKTDNRNKDTLIPTSLLEDLGIVLSQETRHAESLGILGGPLWFSGKLDYIAVCVRTM